MIFAADQPGDALYILRQGSADRFAHGVRLDTVQPPAVFGDLALLRDQWRATTLVAATPVVVWRLPAARFTRVLQRTPGIGARFAAVVSDRLAAKQQELAGLSLEVDDLAERLYGSDALHKLMTELKDRHLNVVGEEVTEDRTIRIRVRNG